MHRRRGALGKLYVAVFDRGAGAPLGRAFASALVDLGLPFVAAVVLPAPGSREDRALGAGVFRGGGAGAVPEASPLRACVTVARRN